MMRSLLFAVVLLVAAPAWAVPTIVVIGDSLSAAYGIDPRQGWVTLLQQRLQEAGYPHRVVNASVSGETTRGGLTRLPEVLDRYRPRLVLLGLGGNDGLRALPLDEIRGNLDAMIATAQGAGARVLLVGIRLPPNYGRRYTRGFAEIYPDLARQRNVPLVPFLLDGVAVRPGMMQSDGIHPTAAAQARLLENVWPVLQPLIAGE